MSIFKDSFHPSIQEQLKKRQTAINNRTPQNLTYYNSRNAWIRLSSGVDVLKKGFNPKTDSLLSASSYDNTLANQYILQGGLLYNGNARAGIGDFSNAYSNVGSDGTAYRLGIRPMPGITGIDIKSKGAYGSLREATINFQCWDIKQLEDLELLYMRPGYTVLLEWGWSPYLNNKGDLVTSVDYTDIINTNWDKEELFKRQYARATDGTYYKEDGTPIPITGYQGNTDSMYGYIKNYSWKARMDGGYDCTTEIISMGEVIESLKVNYSPANNNTLFSSGLLSPNFTKTDGTPFDVSSMTELSGSYTQNILAGIFYEIHEMVRQQAGGFDPGQSDNNGHSWVFYDNKNKKYWDIFRRTINIKGGENSAKRDESIGKTDEQIYITLETLTHIFNDYVLLQDSKNKKPFASISVLEPQTSPPTTPNPISGSGYLLALAHPLQVSVDPTVCLIKSPLWINGINIQLAEGNANISSGTPSPPDKYGTANMDEKFWRELATKVRAANSDNFLPYTESNNLTQFVKNTIGTGEGAVENLKEIQRQFIYVLPKSNYNVEVVNGKKLTDYENFYDLLNEGLTENGVLDAIGVSIFGNSSFFGLTALTINDFLEKAAKENPIDLTKEQLEAKQKELDKQKETGAEGSKFLLLS